METIVIDRSKWRTGDEDRDNGTGIGDTVLKNKEGFLCCLGFMTEQLEPEYELKPYHSMPSSCQTSIPHLSYTDYIPFSKFKTQKNTLLSIQASRINDDCSTTPEEKEGLLKELFKGIFNLEFINEFSTPLKDKENEYVS